MSLHIVYLADPDGGGRLDSVLEYALNAAGEKCKLNWLDGADAFCEAAQEGLLENAKILFAAELDASGINMEMMEVLRYLHRNENCLAGSAAGFLVDGVGECFTKDAGRRLAAAASMAGAVLPGKSLVEGTGSLQNFDVQARNLNTTRRKAYEEAAWGLVKKLLAFREEKNPAPSILAVHASSRKTSNSLALWSKVREHLEGSAHIEEISLRDGEVWDCRGCKYETCLHYGENSSCFYGGVMTEKVYPAVLSGDILLLICPNYNDSVSANIMAFINRLTALFRTNDFSRKQVYALVVSGYSGGDLVVQQIAGAMNMNKNFILPPKFALLATANDPGSIEEIEDIDEKAAEFAARILQCD